MKSIFDYLKKNLTLADYAELIEAWEVHRGADGEENVFDLMDYRDFYLFASLYDADYALVCQKKNRFWFAGNNYTRNSIGSPYTEAITFPITLEEAKKMAIAMIDDEYILDRQDIYEKFFDFDAYHKDKVANLNGKDTNIDIDVIKDIFNVENVAAMTDDLRAKYAFYKDDSLVEIHIYTTRNTIMISVENAYETKRNDTYVSVLNTFKDFLAKSDFDMNIDEEIDDIDMCCTYALIKLLWKE